MKKKKASGDKQEVNLGGDFKTLCRRETELLELRITKEKREAEKATPEKEKEMNRQIKKAKTVRSLIDQMTDGPEKEQCLGQHNKIIIGLLQSNGFKLDEGN